MNKPALLLILMLVMMFAGQGQNEEVLTNENILELVEAGLSPELIVTLIETSSSEFRTDLPTILQLKKAGLADEVLQAMLKAAAVPKSYDPASDGQLLVYISDSDSWSTSGGFTGIGDATDWSMSGYTMGGARPQTAEIIKTFHERCSDFHVTMEREKADYFVILDHEGGKGWLRRDNKVVVFDSTGTSVLSSSTRSLGNAVQDACEKIRDLELAP